MNLVKRTAHGRGPARGPLRHRPVRARTGSSSCSDRSSSSPPCSSSTA
ncbi:MAG: hypothetical protein M0C28_42720 [Candidatus Moduliflexus flocculans]|nr:hypothetical protein [Candidatus Moduliflexus flocculans]